MKLIFGLGNPGRQYERTRHNLGFQVLDILARRHNVVFGPHKFNAFAARLRLNCEDALLIKPMTYMNLSGDAVAPIVRFYKVPLEDVLVIYDDWDLPLGTLRMRPKGGPGSHRGMMSIINRLGTSHFPRLRIGIGRPPENMDPADYVLTRFNEDEEEIIAIAREYAADAVEIWIREGIERAMERANRVSIAPDKQGGP